MAFKDYSPIVVSFTPDTAAYGSGDVVGGLLTPALSICPTVIVGVSVAISEASIAVPGTLYFYKAAPTTFADNAAFAPVYADNEKLIAMVTLPSATLLNTRNVYHIRYGGGSTMPLIEVDQQFYVYYVTSGTPDFAASQEIQISFFQMGER